MFRKLLLIIGACALCAFTLTACGGDDDDDATDEPTMTVPADEAMPTSDAGMTEEAGTGMMGEVAFTVEGDDAVAVTVDAGSWGAPSTASQPFQLLLFEDMSTNILTFQNIPLELEEGMEIELANTADEFDDPEGTFMADMSGGNIFNLLGTITITEVGDGTFSGTLDLNGAAIADDTRSITITGAFSDVPMPEAS
jgi:hypothetical protein